jgi:prevent-host-death family protein
MTTTSMTTADAKENFPELINRVSHHKERIILTRRDKEIVAVIPIEDLALLITNQSKNDLQDAVDALKEARSQGTITLQDLETGV